MIVASAQSPSRSFIVEGTVSDFSSKLALSNITVSLTGVDNKHYSITKSGTDGAFSFETNTAGRFILLLTATEFFSASDTIEIPATSLSNRISLQPIFLLPVSKSLANVTVTSKRPLITQEADRIIYDVQSDPESKVQTLFDMLRKAPLVTVTVDDKIQLKSSPNFRILINGRTTSMTTNSPETFLKGMSATLVDKIEIITIPPSKYDAEGLAGIINIIIKKNIGEGYVGSFTANHSELISSLSGNLTAKFNKFGITTFINNSWQRAPQTSFSNIIKPVAGDAYLFSQEGKRKFKSYTGIAAVEGTYEFDSLNLLTLSLTLYAQNSKSPSSRYSQIINNSVISQSYNLTKEDNTNDDGFDIGINYALGFKRDKKQILTFAYKYSSQEGSRPSWNRITERLNYSDLAMRLTNDEGIRESTFQIDLTYPVKNGTIESGAKLIGRTNKSEYATFLTDDFGNDLSKDLTNSNNLNYSQKVLSIYNSYRMNFKEYSISTGLRFEYTKVEDHLNIMVNSLEQQYNNLIPSFVLQRRFKVSSVDIGYTQRIQRPAIWQQNPFVNKSDPFFEYSGNPDLVAVVRHQLSSGYSWFKKGFLRTNVEYGFTRNAIQSVTEFGLDSISRSTYYNIGRNKSLALNVSFSYPVSSRITLTVNGNSTYVWLNGNVSGAEYSNKGIQGNAYTYIMFRFKREFTSGLNAGFYSPQVILQGYSRGYFYYSASVSKGLFNSKGSFTASVTNPFTAIVSARGEFATTDAVQIFNQERYIRNFSISFSYRFGKLRQGVRKNQKTIQNDDINKSSNTENNKAITN